MKSLWKISAIAAVAMTGSLAQADVILSNTTTGSELVLFVRDTSAGAAPDRVYARGLGITVDDVLTAAGAGGTYTGAGSPISFQLPAAGIGPDANLTAFLGGGTSFVWTVMAGDSVGTTAFSQRYVTTTQQDLTQPGAPIPINSAIRTVWSQISPMLNDLNGALPDSPGSSTSTNGQWGQSGGSYENATSWFAGGIGNENALGSSANLYVLTNSSTVNTGAARVFAALDLVLDANGVLKTVNEVPLPPALLLLGSAFAGLAGVARRKQNKAVAV
ncbi:MAG TPA: hypothetical protein VMF52_11830 [Steroidobacteraceae bacterium]|nr:hypothetical protein [Steroidobacteraceae bacterium]